MTEGVVPAPSSEVAAVDVMEQDASIVSRALTRLLPSNDLRRFAKAVTTGLLAALVPYVWILWDFWDGAPHPFRTTRPGNFYDLQARAMLQGHLSVASGALGIEGFVHDGRTYTYFGIFPSLIRMPILLLTHRLDGRLTAPSMLLGWLMAGVFCALLLWRIRLLMRGPAPLERMEAASYGLLIAATMGGSVFVFLASDTWVFHEDLVWSVALTVGSLFALLGVMERPSWGRISASGILVLAATLNRVSTGYACIVGALLVAGWLALGRGGRENRRWVLPMALAGLVPLAAVAVVNLLKFGVPITVPLTEQVFTKVNAHRRAVLASTGGRGYGLQFLPSTLYNYLQPGGIRLTPVFPFFTLPAEPARAVGGLILDRTTRTASIPSSMPVLFLLSCWGVIATFRRRPLGRGNLMRIIVVAGALGFGTVLIFDYIDDRYLADFLPFLIVASAVGLVDLLGRAHNWHRSLRGLLAGALAVLTVLSMGMNLAVASTAQPNWSAHRAVLYVRRQVSVANLIGTPLTENIMHGRFLPNYAPADKLFVVGNCRALYLSNGETYNTFPKQLIEHDTWIPIETPSSFKRRFSITVNASLAGLKRPLPLMAIGRTTVQLVPEDPDHIRFDLSGPGVHDIGQVFKVKLGVPYRVVVNTDPYLRFIMVTFGHQPSLVAVLPSGHPAVVTPLTAPGSPVQISILEKTRSNAKAGTGSLCRNVLDAG